LLLNDWLGGLLGLLLLGCLLLLFGDFGVWGVLQLAELLLVNGLWLVGLLCWLGLW
jgi:hypothetical protein